MSETENIAAPVCWAANADAGSVADHISEIIQRSGSHWLAVPGGKTPLPIFDILSRRTLPWGTVSLMLTDDRIVPPKDPASNQDKLDAAFDATPAHVAKLVEGMPLPLFDLVWLGMGADGHIASLFPNMDPTAQGKAAVIHTVPEPLPQEAPFERLSLNLAALTQAKEIMLVVRGCDKKRVLDAAIAGENDLPVARLFAAARCPITIFWSRT
ncbi:6-phosphogluconolactonase [uncultured Parasphingorhabdus sp.]|uniref:6-phosphogluconolactonase n=1 Tax=uncultured Parasphingorhabdus sp. TaxID=2709694 RepID=UPI002AA812EE|nr:6-phosphogluconolactonase [uncultured Parasphingorhabdus sp.]